MHVDVYVDVVNDVMDGAARCVCRAARRELVVIKRFMVAGLCLIDS